MSDDEDDYLSDKFLLGDSSASSSSRAVPASSSKPKTYTELRKEALRASEAKQAAYRASKKSKRDTIQDGLETSLFDKAREQEEAGLGSNKAFEMMRKMGFKPGQSLGRKEDSVGAGENAESGQDDLSAADSSATARPTLASAATGTSNGSGHRVEPVSINFWEGRSGIGQKRSATSKSNPYAPLPKKARTVDAEAEARQNESAEAFRERTRLEYEERRAEARLIVATKTCVSLDETKGGITFNILWLNPKNPNTCPSELLDAFARDASAPDEDSGPFDPNAPRSRSSSPLLDDEGDGNHSGHPRKRRRQSPSADNNAAADNEMYAARLREQMRKDALQPSEASDDFGDEFAGSRPFGARVSASGRDYDDEDVDTGTLVFTPEQVAEAREFLRLSANDRLARLLDYLRRKYSYCFWCGTSYEDEEDMKANCPGEDEESHD